MKINQLLLEFVSASPETKELTIGEVEEVLCNFGSEVVLLRDTMQKTPYLITGTDEAEVSFGVNLNASGVKPLFKIAAAVLADDSNTRTFLCVSIVDTCIRFHWPGENKKTLVYSFELESGAGFEFESEDPNEDGMFWDLYGDRDIYELFGDGV